MYSIYGFTEKVSADLYIISGTERKFRLIVKRESASMRVAEFMNRKFQFFFSFLTFFFLVPLFLTFSTGENVFYVCMSERVGVPVARSTFCVIIQFIICTILRGKFQNWSSFFSWPKVLFCLKWFCRLVTS